MLFSDRMIGTLADDASPNRMASRLRRRPGQNDPNDPLAYQTQPNDMVRPPQRSRDTTLNKARPHTDVVSPHVCGNSIPRTRVTRHGEQFRAALNLASGAECHHIIPNTHSQYPTGRGYKRCVAQPDCNSSPKTLGTSRSKRSIGALNPTERYGTPLPCALARQPQTRPDRLRTMLRHTWVAI